MVFSGACSEYTDAHSCSEGETLRLSCLIAKKGGGFIFLL